MRMLIVSLLMVLASAGRCGESFLTLTIEEGGINPGTEVYQVARDGLVRYRARRFASATPFEATWTLPAPALASIRAALEGSHFGDLPAEVGEARGSLVPFVTTVEACWEGRWRSVAVRRLASPPPPPALLDLLDTLRRIVTEDGRQPRGVIR